VSVPWPRNPPPSVGGLQVHHIDAPFPSIHVIDGVPTVSTASAITTSWPWLRGSDQRAPFIAAVQRGLTTPDAVQRELRRSTRVRGRRALLELAQLIEEGCESELELWGYLEVFTVPGLDHGERQRLITVGSRTFRLDLAYEKERLAVELDGRGYHSSDDQWERDIARDLAIATRGWQTVRLPHKRLMNDVDGCRREVLEVLAARRQMRLSS
jgi:very-short-patch-repair endonuclease